jgi:integrase/recombinase XerD
MRPQWMEAILAVPDFSLWTGQRDHALLLTMYNGGGRVSEITGLSWQQVRFGTTTYLDLNGKGRKERRVPLWPKTAKVLPQWRRRQAKLSTADKFASAVELWDELSSNPDEIPVTEEQLNELDRSEGPRS